MRNLHRPGPIPTVRTLSLILLFVIITAHTASGQTTAFEVTKTSDSSSLLRILDDGKVRIGISAASPSTTLDLITTAQMSTAETLLKAYVSDNATAFISFYNNGSGSGQFAPSILGLTSHMGIHGLSLIGDVENVDMGSTAAILIQGQAGAGPTTSRDVLLIRNFTTELVAVDKDGSVGIGTTSPAEKLDINGAVKLGTTSSTNAGTIRWTGSNFEGYTGTSWLPLDVQTMTGGGWTDSGTDVHLTASTDQVGIGTSSPAEPLSVAGGRSLGSLGAEGNLLASAVFDPTPGHGVLLGGTSTGENGTVWTTGSTRDLLFGTLISGTPIERMRIESGGNIGIGTSSPSAKLDVVGTTELNGNVSINSNFTVDTNTLFVDGTNHRVGIGTTSPTTELEIDGELRVGDTYTGPQASARIYETANRAGVLALSDQGTIKTSISAHPSDPTYFNHGGNVGIGTTSPTVELEIDGAGTMIQATYSSLTNGPVIQIGVDAADGSSVIAANHISGTPSLDLHLNTRNAGTNNEVMTLKGNGDVGIGTSSPSHPLHMASGAHVTSGGVWTNASSRILKENISPLPLEPALKTLSALRPVTYNYKVDKEEHYVGFIAEDVPELVATADHKSLAPMDIVAVLTKVVQDQRRTMVHQRTMLEQQQKELDDLKARMARVEVALEQRTRQSEQ